MLSRRQFLSGLLLPLALRVPSSPAPAALPALRLFFDAADLPALRRRFASPLFAGLREKTAVIDRADLRRFMQSEVRYNDHLFHLARLYDVAPRLAFQHAMTGDEDAADLAAAAIRTILKFPKWDYFLEAGRDVFGLQRAPGSALAVALCADWLGDRIDETERDAWLRTMGERGLEPSYRALYGMRYPERVVGWTMDETSTFFEHRPTERIDLSNWPRILNDTNLKAVPASALAIGAAAYRARFGPSDDTERWLEQALFSLRSLRDLFAADGSYPEGVSYAAYTTLHLAQATAVLHRLAGTDLFDLIDWPGYVVFLREMSMPTNADPKAIVNFGDASTGASSAVPFWVAGRTFDGRAQWTGLHLGHEHDLWSLLWYDESLPAEPPPAGPHLWHAALDWVVARTGYAPDDLVVAMRSGGPGNHEHADRGSLVVKAFGEPLVVDPHRPPYDRNDPAWLMRHTAGHSALLIDGQGHQYHDGSEGTNSSDAQARIVRAEERAGHLAWTSDATDAYRLVLPDVASVTRTVVVLPELPAVLVFDKVHKTQAPSKLQARFFGYNLDGHGRIDAEGASFRIIRPGATLRAVAFAPGGAVVRTALLPIPEEKAPLHPFAEVGAQEAGLSPSLLSVLLPERSGEQAAAEVTEAESGVFDVALRHGARTAHVRFFDTGTIPEYQVLHSE